jgi:hypothetical protein
VYFRAFIPEASASKRAALAETPKKVKAIDVRRIEITSFTGLLTQEDSAIFKEFENLKWAFCHCNPVGFCRDFFVSWMILSSVILPSLKVMIRSPNS